MFRFESLEIWKQSIEVAEVIFDIADEMEKKKLFRFADQLRGAALSISNNIAEGSGSVYKREFAQFVNIARRSVFENANMIIIFARRGLISKEHKDEIIQRLDLLSRQILSFQRTLR